MISARFFLAGEQYTGCEISGHADYSEEGTDVICAYVSATVQTVANLMTEIFRLPVSAAEQEEPAHLRCRPGQGRGCRWDSRMHGHPAQLQRCGNL